LQPPGRRSCRRAISPLHTRCLGLGRRAPEARITGCDLSYADLSYAQLAGAALADCDLTDANLHGVDTGQVSLAGCTTRRTRMTDRDRLYGETWKPPD